jgi:hypothetical protein
MVLQELNGINGKLSEVKGELSEVKGELSEVKGLLNRREQTNSCLGRRSRV